MHFASYEDNELFIGGQPGTGERPDITVELSDWSMSRRQQARAAATLTPLLVCAFDTEPDAVNVRFHPYPPADVAVGGRLRSTRLPYPARLAKKLFG